MEMIKIEESKLKKALQRLNRFKCGAYIYFKGIIEGKVTFYKFCAKIDKDKITITDSLKDDTISLDLAYVSLVKQSVDKRKLELNLENEEVVTIEV